MTEFQITPESFDAVEASTKNVKGKLWFVGNQALGISGGENPGQWTFTSDGIREVALAALAQNANVWAIVEGKYVIQFTVFAP